MKLGLENRKKVIQATVFGVLALGLTSRKRGTARDHMALRAGFQLDWKIVREILLLNVRFFFRHRSPLFQNWGPN